MKKIIFVVALLFFLLGAPKAVMADTACPNIPISGNYTVNTPSPGCYIAAAGTVAGIDNAGGSEVSTNNVAVLTIGAGSTLTIPSGPAPESLTKLLTGSVIIQNGGTIVLGSNAQMKISAPVYVADNDADGWADSFTYHDATASGRRRMSLMRSISTADCSGSTYSENNSCGYRRNLALTYSGTTLSDHDIVWSVNTQAAISAGHMTADCGDISIKDSDGTTPLAYWIESGCNTTNTQIWTRVPSIPDGGKTIYMDYDGSTTTDGFQAWAGSFTLMNTGACPAGWTQNADFDSKFFQGSTVYGTIGGSDSHAHDQASCTTNSVSLGGCRTGGGSTGSPTHSHTGAKVNIGTALNVLPPYLDIVMCKNNNLVIPASFVAMFDTSVPAGWTRFSALDSKFPRGAINYGATGGATTHTHTKTGGIATGSSGSTAVCKPSPCESDYAKPHTHTTGSGTITAADNTPPYLDMIFGQVNAQTAATTGLIAITDILPPLGWSRFSALDSKFPRGAAAYSGIGSSSAHTHSVSIATGGPSAAACGAGSGGNPGSRYNHTHSCATTSSSFSNLPPYTDTLFVKRNTPIPTISVGDEGSQ